ncbi:MULTISPECIES: DUF1116 domain-containing protein [unclassified Exiguobacterium]|uniref:DUF1116 domain-containing protein n=1 Tax=unclassified Exiguobacterium TaxID=2644629 RepID=UPI001BEC62B9|nr:MULTISPECIES: DUF1116 domain-containing protein [unclassified Exiguobacterium]
MSIGAMIQEANEKVVQTILNGQPFLTDVVPAHTVIPILKDKVLLHAGPPIAYHEMTGPMKGAAIGAVIFEQWTDDYEEAEQMLERGEVTFTPCHHVNAVGPMGGITSGHMPVLVVENRNGSAKAYCTMNEGIGKVMRFGANDAEVISRLHWMKDVLGPVLSKTLKETGEGVNLNVIISKAITMGDEFHQRNIAASVLLLKELAPYLMLADIDDTERRDVLQFLADTDQFFLNVMMATCKAVLDEARQHEEGTIVTAMTRNGKEFGIRISGMGDKWFTAPVNTPEGLFFTGYSQDDANPDIGDSAITETYGVGGMAMVAAPGVTRFLGRAGASEAQSISEEMIEICDRHNSNLSIPSWDFQGSCVGIDIRKVVETGITPIINTGIAHKKPGIGQVGAGTVRAPLACFEKALEAYAEKLGLVQHA